MIGRRVACAFCRTVFQSSFEELPQGSVEPTPENHPEKKNGLTRWIPSRADIATTASKIGTAALDAASSAASTTSAAAVAATAKRAAATSMTQVVTGLALTVLPGVGEVMSGKTTQGFCTLAAFIGVTTIATTATGGAWIAVPVAIQVFSAAQGVRGGRQLAQKMRDAIEASNAEELEEAARILREEAAKTTAQEFERLMLEKEEAEPKRRRVVLTRVQTKPVGE